MHNLKKFLTRFSHPIRGLKHAIRNDISFGGQIVLGAIVVSIVWWVFKPLAYWEWLFVFLMWFLVLITELQNSAIEEALDHLHPERHESVGRTKDMAAGAVLLAGVYALIVVIVLTLVRQG